MSDIDQFIARMDSGFNKLHDRLDDIVQQTTTRRLDCGARFGSIEQNIAIRTAVNGMKDTQKAQRVAFQTWLVRGALMSIILGIGTILWKIFLGHIDLVIK